MEGVNTHLLYIYDVFKCIYLTMGDYLHCHFTYMYLHIKRICIHALIYARKIVYNICSANHLPIHCIYRYMQRRIQSRETCNLRLYASMCMYVEYIHTQCSSPRPPLISVYWPETEIYAGHYDWKRRSWLCRVIRQLCNLHSYPQEYIFPYNFDYNLIA